MSNDNKLESGKEICEEKKELTQEELEQVSGGVDPKKIKDVLIAGAIATVAPTVLK